MSPPDKLAPYRAKRSADATSEPFGAGVEGAGASGPGLFVVHKHSATRLHYDLRLEMGGVLMSWAVPKGPSLDPEEKRYAVHVEDHPLEYADFEGIIPEENYGAGPSIVWDRGTWVPIEGKKHGLEHGKLLFELHGHKLKGRWQLIQLKGKPKDWLLIKKPDAYAQKDPPPWPETSIYSGVDVEALAELPKLREAVRRELEAAKVPRGKVDARTLELMLAETADAPFSREGWIFELKYDGFRLVVARNDGKSVMRYRRGSDASGPFPELARAVAGLPYDCVLDCELVVQDEKGHPSFNRLQQRVQLQRALDIARAQVSLPATLFAFDCLALEGHDLRGLPLLERKKWLKHVLPPVGPIRYADHIETLGAELFAQVRSRGLEGVMAKRANAPYRGGRRPDWKKVRGERTGEFAVVGFTLPEGSRVGLGALDLAAWDGTRFVYVGGVGTGFSDKLLESLREELEPSRVSKRQFVGELTPGRKHVWLEPKRVAEVAFFDWSADRHLREPRFVRMRPDKTPQDCTLSNDGPPKASAPIEEVRRVVVSNRQKVFFPDDGITKGDLVDYYRAISPWLLPYLKDRPVVLTRYPDGIGGKNFFQKDAPPFVPNWLRTVRVWSEISQRDIDYFVVDDENALAYLANLGTIPLHVWSSRVGALQSPDWSIIDLDPKGAPFSDVVKVAKKVHQICDAIGLPCFAKTSGSTGLHVLLPLGGQCSYDESRALAELISRVVVEALPDICTLERVVSARGGKVYLDYLQNGHGRLLVAPFSVRPLPKAPVSMPLKWSEVTPKTGPTKFTIANAVARMKKLGEDPLADVLGKAPDIGQVVQRLGAKLHELAK
ncbi:MAG: DNA ligase D [Deltaproteobacteria bacterium]|nr:DNA ligase D [Deltaproteobacteria bacterium]